jgi:hypothetical protein
MKLSDKSQIHLLTAEKNKLIKQLNKLVLRVQIAKRPTTITQLSARCQELNKQINGIKDQIITLQFNKATTQE